MFAKRVAVAVLLCAAACSSDKPTPHASTATRIAAATTTTSALPKAVAVMDLSWISTTHGWALVDTPSCSEPVCPSVLTTVDGGETWSSVGGPLSNVANLRFANASTGYAFNPDFATTHDGGATWTAQPGPHVLALETDGRNVVRLAYETDGCPGPCGLTLERATVGGAAWQRADAPRPASAAQGAVLARDGHDDVYAAFMGNPAGGAENAQSDLLASHDSGRTWASRGEPCWPREQGDEIDTRAIAAAPQGVVAALCEPRTTEGAPTIIISSDGGKTFGPKRTVPEDVIGDIALTSKSDVFVATGPLSGNGTHEFVVLASHDGGRTWTKAASDSEPLQAPEVGFSGRSFLGFESTTVGRWVGDSHSVWTTTDNGDHWKPHRF